MAAHCHRQEEAGDETARMREIEIDARRGAGMLREGSDGRIVQDRETLVTFPWRWRKYQHHQRHFMPTMAALIIEHSSVSAYSSAGGIRYGRQPIIIND